MTQSGVSNKQTCKVVIKFSATTLFFSLLFPSYPISCLCQMSKWEKFFFAARHFRTVVLHTRSFNTSCLTQGFKMIKLRQREREICEFNKDISQESCW